MTASVRYINPTGSGPAQGLYSHVGEVTASGSRLAFIAGQLSVGSDGSIVGAADFKAQFKQVFDNLGAVLTGLGGGYEHVVKFTTYLVHSQDIGAFMESRASLFPTIFKGPLYPPNTLLMVDRLVKEPFLIEVEAVALLPAE